MFTLIPQDKANHEVYGARIATVAAIIAVFICAQVLPEIKVIKIPVISAALLVASATAVVSSLFAALIKEWSDYTGNKNAAEQGQPAPHTVDKEDIYATVRGGISVGAPLLAVWGLMYL